MRVVIVSIDLTIFCSSCDIASLDNNSMLIDAQNISFSEVEHLTKQIIEKVSNCEVLDHFDEEQLIEYMQEKYGVTRMVK